MVLFYFVVKCLVVECDGMLIMLDDECMILWFGEVVEEKMVCFCMFGCYLLIGVIELEVDILEGIVWEMLIVCMLECQGWLIDKDEVVFMEKKKCEGYF